MPSPLQLRRISPSNPLNATTALPHTAGRSKPTPETTDACQRSPLLLPPSEMMPESVVQLHSHLPLSPNQCSSTVVQTVDAPVAAVWSMVRRFDEPQSYKRFLKSCRVVHGDGDVGTVREVGVVSGLPAVSSRERLEILDDERHVMSFRIVGGEHRLANYKSVMTLHDEGNGSATVVVESYVVDVPQGNSSEDTRIFVDTIVRCNLQSLARIFSRLTRTRPTEK